MLENGINQYDAKCKVFLVRVSGLADAGLGVAMIRSRGRHHPDTGAGTMLSTLSIAWVSTLSTINLKMSTVSTGPVSTVTISVSAVLAPRCSW